MTQDESGRYEVENSRMFRSTNRSRAAGPETRFRIIHAAVHGQNGAPLAPYREQQVEVAFGPMGILEDCDVGTLTRRIEPDKVVITVYEPDPSKWDSGYRKRRKE